jgi:hypothetical protein
MPWCVSSSDLAPLVVAALAPRGSTFGATVGAGHRVKEGVRSWRASSVIIILVLAGCGSGAGLSRDDAGHVSTDVVFGTLSAAPVRRVAVPPSQHPVTPSIPRSAGRVGFGASGGLLRLHVGQQRVVELGSEFVGGYGNWSRLSASAGGVDRIAQQGGYPSSSSLVATLTAERNGSVVVSAGSDAPCFHVKPACAMAMREWRITVVVT